MSSTPEANDRRETAGAWCVKLAEGALSTLDQMRLESWLAEDPLHREALDDCVGVWRAMGEDSTSPVLLALRRDALADFERANRARWSKVGAFRPARLLAMAVSILLLIGGAALWWTLTPTTYRTGVGERRVVALGDGSKLSLDAATEVRVRYSDHARRLWLTTGRAKFDVAHDRSRPFTVAAANKLVRATGTAFSVELIGGDVRVALYQGRVLVTGKQQAPGAQIVAPAAAGFERPTATVLKPGQELIASVRIAEARIAAVDPARSLAWEGGQLVFESEPLSVAVERMNRYSPEKLSVGDAAAASIPIDGVFEAGDTMAFVEGVTGVFPVRAHPTEDGISFVARP